MWHSFLRHNFVEWIETNFTIYLVLEIEATFTGGILVWLKVYQSVKINLVVEVKCKPANGDQTSNTC